MNHKRNDNRMGSSYLFNLSLANVLRLTMFGTLITLTKDITRLPLNLPGHTSLYWMGLLVLGKGLIPQLGSGLIMGVVSGILAVLLGVGKEGFLVFFKYLIPGLLIDLLAPLFAYKLEKPIIGALCGVITSLSKMVVNIVLGLLMKMPLVFLTIGLGLTSISHMLFGAIGGFIAAALIKRLRPRLTDWD